MILRQRESVALQLAVERGGFRPGTYQPYGFTRYVFHAFGSPSLPNSILLASAPFYADGRGAETSFVQMDRCEEG